MTVGGRSGEDDRRGPGSARPTVLGSVVQGGAAFGGLYRPVDDETVHEALQTAWDLGVRAFDTAPHYGVGVSEERLGRFLAERPREEFTLSTKVGRLLVDDPAAPTEDEGFAGTPRRRRVRDYSAAGVRRSLEESLTRLGLDRVDLALIHDPEDHLDTAVQEAGPALSALRDEGVIGGYGVGTNFSEVALRLVQQTDLDAVLIAGRYTLLDRRAEAQLLPACTERGVQVLTAGLLNSGLLADPDAADPHFDYAAASPEIVTVAQELQRRCRRFGVELRAAALQFPLRHPAVAAVVTGAGTAAEVRDCHAQLEADIDAELWAELDEVSARL
jgi:D-threo-aldose 1-dehydrogenase